MKRSILKVFIFLAAVFILLIFFHLINFDQKIIRAFYQLGFRLGVKLGGLSIFNFKNYQQENLFLKQQLERLLSENTQLKILAGENETLKKYLNFSERNEEKLVIANIIGRKSELSFNWFILDRGSQDGIRPSLAVINENGFLLGKISRVTENFSYFLPLFDSHSLIAADIIKSVDNKNPRSAQNLVFGEEEIYSENKEEKGSKLTSGLVKGKHGLSMEMDYIPLDKSIEPGDYVITSGLESEIRRKLIIGQIEEVIKEPGAFSQKAIIKPLINFDTVRIVGVLIPAYEY